MKDIEVLGIPFLSKGSGIHIKKENEGKFTASAKEAGQSVLEHAQSVLNNPNATPLQKKRANFARNAAKWHHTKKDEKGGELTKGVHKPSGHRSILDNGWFKTKDLKKNHPLVYLQGGPFSTGALVDTIYKNGTERKYGKGNYNNVNPKLLAKLKPGPRDHYDDIVKYKNHPTHPSRGTFTKDGMKFYMSDFGMLNPNLTLFGTADHNQDGLTTMIYKGGVVLPEITVTSDGKKYIDNTYDQIKIYLK